MIRFLIAAGCGAAVTVMEQSLENVSNGNRLILAAAILVPAALLCWWLERRAARPAAPVPAPRPSYPLTSGMQGRRR
jgi:hypothetical protein